LEHFWSEIRSYFGCISGVCFSSPVGLIILIKIRTQKLSKVMLSVIIYPYLYVDQKFNWRINPHIPENIRVEISDYCPFGP
jgi:hypothetical protein